VEALVDSEGVRLVTLTGPGGSGKSRLAIEAAGRLRPDFADGAAGLLRQGLSLAAEAGDRAGSLA
jgi:predicted ATPase